jgi:two-component system sensor histidine kinase KdpD
MQDDEARQVADLPEQRHPDPGGEAAAAVRDQRLRRGFEASAAVITAGLEAADTDTALARMVREIRARFDWGHMTVMLRQPDGELRCVAALEDDAAHGAVVPDRRGIVGHVLATGRAYLASEVDDDPRYVSFYPDTRSEMCAPLTVSGRTIGALNAEVSDRAFAAEDLEVLARLVEQMSLVIHNTTLLTTERETVSRLHELDRMKSRLLTIAGHELRTPLTVVLGFAETLAANLDTFDAERAREYADAIARQAVSLSATVDQMLVASQMEQGQLAVQPTPCELLEVVAEVLRGRSAAVEVLPGTDLRVLADPFRLRQVLESLLDNAVTYASDAGRIQVDARRSGRTVTVLVSDEGPGIPPAEREAVFEPFHQVGEHGVAGRRGLGLGLAVARDLLRLMGGELTLATAEGYGATFRLTLPAP